MGALMLEITDLLWQIDDDGELLPVVKAEVVAFLLDRHQRRAARIVSRMPAADGVLDPGYVNALGIRVHCELVRLSEELQFGRRVAARLEELVVPLRAAGRGLIRVVDLGCGIGYVVRWLAATSALGPDVELVGVDLNPTLVAQANKLAALEGLTCHFLRGDAFEPGPTVQDPARTVVISSGLMHHISPQDLPGFFAAQARLGVAAFAHWDIA